MKQGILLFLQALPCFVISYTQWPPLLLQTTMGNFYEAIPDNLLEWIPTQEAFWVATAPLAGDGHVNVSPKGLRGTFHVESPTRGKCTSSFI